MFPHGKRGGPGAFPHVSDVKGRKTVEKPSKRTWAYWVSEPGNVSS